MPFDYILKPYYLVVNNPPRQVQSQYRIQRSIVSPTKQTLTLIFFGLGQIASMRASIMANGLITSRHWFWPLSIYVDHGEAKECVCLGGGWKEHCYIIEKWKGVWVSPTGTNNFWTYIKIFVIFPKFNDVQLGWDQNEWLERSKSIYYSDYEATGEKWKDSC